MTTAEAAAALGLAPSTVRRQIAQGRIRARRAGRDWRISEAEVERYRAESLGQPGRRGDTEMYEISRDGLTLGSSRAGTPDEAATRYARRVWGRRAMALRVTGDRGLSGMFQAYLPARTGGQTSTGDPYHVG